ncbi:MAG TPA: hypothetical protein VMJ10_27765 [Kofleriaceae bacterium]|nr:hypothetical protein [Kofleriaceae bacterium]
MAVVSSTAWALSNSVISAFRGQLVITKDELPEGKNDSDTIKKIKAASLKELDGEVKGDVTSYYFHYTAFLSRTGATQLKMEFMKDGKLSADKQLTGVDPKNSVLTGDITIDEDEGVTKGKTYTVQLVTSGDQVVAKTTLTLK